MFERLFAVPVVLALLAPVGLAQDEEVPPEAGIEEEIERVAPESDAELPEVFVTGRVAPGAFPSVPLTAVGSRDVFGPDIIRNNPARDLNDLIKLLPAISTRPYNGGEAAAPSFSTRGLPDDGLTEYILVLVDGVPASPMPFGWTAFSFLSATTENIHAIDVHRGAHAVRYSPNTVGGVLNLITKPIPQEPTLELKQTYGSFGYRSSVVDVGGTQDGLGYLFTFVDREGNGFRDAGEFDQQDLSLKLRFQEQEDVWVEAKVAYFADLHKAPGGLTQAQYRADRFANARPMNEFDGYRTVVDVVAHRDYDTDTWAEGFFQFSSTGRRLVARRPHFGAAATKSDWEDESFFASLGIRGGRTVEFAGLEHELFGGVRIHREWMPGWTMHSSPIAGGVRTKVLDTEYRIASWSAHVDDTFHPAEDVTVTLGARLEWVPHSRVSDSVAGEGISHHFLDVLPGAGASWAVTDQAALFANYHESFRAPQAWGYDVANNPQDLDFEKGSNLEAGVRFDGPSGLSGSVAAWWVDFDDVGVFYTGYYENLGRIRARGTDVVLNWDAGTVSEAFEGLRFYGNWTHQSSELRDGPNAGNDTPYAWNDKWVLGARYVRDAWTFAVDGTYTGGSYSDEPNTRPESINGTIGKNDATLFWDAKVSRSFPLGENAEGSVSVGVTNLLDAREFVHSRGGFFGGGKVAYAPRQVFASIGVSVWW